MKSFKNQRVVNASREHVFNAFEDPVLLAKWWGPSGFSCIFKTFEFKPNGKWSFVMNGPDGASYPNESVFQEIDKPHKVVVRHIANPLFTVTLTLKTVDGKTVVTWVQDFDDEKIAESIAHIVKPANEQVMDKLQTIVEGK